MEENFAQGQDKDVIHILKIKFWYVWQGQRGEIEHFGQTTFVGKNKNGYYTDEEAPKKSLTDAISKCISLLGFAADVHPRHVRRQPLRQRPEARLPGRR